ncbi:erythromycin esterase family protein [soil metagenome]
MLAPLLGSIGCAHSGPVVASTAPAAEEISVQEIGGGEERTHPVTMATGERVRITIVPPAAGMWLRVYAPDSAWVAERFTPDSTPPAPLEILAEAAGVHRIVVESMPTAPPSPYEIRVNRLTVQENARETAALDSATAWLRRSAHPLATVQPGDSYADPAPLKTILSAVRVVGIGESTHGTREFHQLGARLAQFLVQEMGYTVFAVETSEIAAHAINEYVLRGIGDRAAVLAGQGTWNFDTEDFSSLLDWMREYNRTAPAARRVRFAGFDMQYNPGSRDTIVAYLRRVAPDRVPATDSVLAVLTEAPDPARPDFVRYYTLQPEAKRPILQAISELHSYLESNREQLAALSSATQASTIARRVKLLVQFADAHSRPGFDQSDSTSGVATRDRHMAENVLHALEADPATKIVLYTHAEHARRDPYRMGYYLSAALRDSYYALGIGFHRGGFQALRIGGGNPPRLEAFTFPVPFQYSVGWYMNRAGIGDLFVDFRGVPTQGAVAEWLSRPLAMRSVGNGYAPGNPSGYYRAPVVLGRSFDGIAFVEETTRARSNPTVRR